jgi:hypothetical protein
MEICVHGNSGQVQDRDADATPNGYGLLVVVLDYGPWVHYSIPINAGTKIKAIRFYFHRYGKKIELSWIRHVEIYHGHYCRKKFHDLYLGKDTSARQNDRINKVLDFGESIEFKEGLGVSICPESTHVPDSHPLGNRVEFVFNSVCAITE